jgi:hypothetical protein
MAMVVLGVAGQTTGSVVSSGIIELPRIGPWRADLKVDAPAALTGKVEIRIGKSDVLKGTVIRGGMYEGMFCPLIGAGGAGMRAKVTPKHYTSPTLRNVLSDLCGDAGEAISSASDADTLMTQLPHWTTLRMEAGVAIRLLMESAPSGTSWRMLADGTLWVGPETWPASQVTEFREVAQTPEDAVVELGLDQPFLLPGTTLGGRKLDQVNIEITGGKVKTTVWVAS